MNPISHLFEAQVEQTPNRIALVDGDDHVSFHELNRRADRYAAWFRSLGLGPQSRIALSLGRSVELVTAFLAIFKIGATCVPIDPKYPSARKSFVYKHASSQLLFTQTGLDFLDNESFFVNELFNQLPQVEPIKTPIHCDELMLILYTSGSTGAPKGVMVPYTSTVNRFLWMYDQFPFTETDVAISKTSIGFVDAQWEMFGGL